MRPVPPGEILTEEFLKPLGLTANALAKAIGVPPNRYFAAWRAASCCATLPDTMAR
jgi:addiction module HigA family antidote